MLTLLSSSWNSSSTRGCGASRPRSRFAFQRTGPPSSMRNGGTAWSPLRLVQAPLNHDGLRIRIRSLIKKPDPADVRRALLARANVLALRGYGPFEVSVNGEQVKPEELRGSTLLPVNIATEYGRITGEIMIMPISKVRAGISEAGISVQQKHITCLQHQFFGLDQYRTHGLSRIQGWVNADFLRRLPGGNDFEHDSPQ